MLLECTRGRDTADLIKTQIQATHARPQHKGQPRNLDRIGEMQPKIVQCLADKLDWIAAIERNYLKGFQNPSRIGQTDLNTAPAAREPARSPEAILAEARPSRTALPWRMAHTERCRDRAQPGESKQHTACKALVIQELGCDGLDARRLTGMIEASVCCSWQTVLGSRRRASGAFPLDHLDQPSPAGPTHPCVPLTHRRPAWPLRPCCC
jgi:hypothetical protein